jgi:hypothetical protein
MLILRSIGNAGQYRCDEGTQYIIGFDCFGVLCCVFGTTSYGAIRNIRSLLLEPINALQILEE